MKFISLNAAIKLSNTQAIIDFLKHEKADLVALQEVARHLSDNVHRPYRTKADIEQALSDRYPYSFLVRSG